MGLFEIVLSPVPADPKVGPVDPAVLGGSSKVIWWMYLRIFGTRSDPWQQSDQ